MPSVQEGPTPAHPVSGLPCQTLVLVDAEALHRWLADALQTLVPGIIVTAAHEARAERGPRRPHLIVQPSGLDHSEQLLHAAPRLESSTQRIVFRYADVLAVARAAGVIPAAEGYLVEWA